MSRTDLVVVGSVFYLGVDVATARCRNLQRDPAIAVMLVDDSKSTTAKIVLEALKKGYGWVTDALAEFHPVKIFTLKSK